VGEALQGPARGGLNGETPFCWLNTCCCRREGDRASGWVNGDKYDIYIERGGGKTSDSIL